MEMRVVAGHERAESTKEKATAASRLNYCRTYTAGQVAKALPEIVEKFTEEARKGSIAHVKMLLTLGGLDSEEVVRRRPKSSVRLLMESWEKEVRVHEGKLAQ